MRFGFDIDDTLINLREHAFHIYNKKLSQKLDSSVFQSIKRVEIHEPFGLTDEEGTKMWNDTLEEIYYTDCPSFPGAKETLNQLHQDGHSIFYITARPKEHGERTKEWMINQGFPIIDDHFFHGMKDEDKIHTIKKLHLDFYVDDKPTILQTLANEEPKLLLKDQPYNQQEKHFTRIVDWADFFKLISI